VAKLSTIQDLIQSLSKAEKRRFRLASNHQGGDKSYLQLFDFYLKHPDADLHAVKHHFKFKPKLQIGVLNDYLYQRLLANLKSLHQRGSVDFQIRELLQQAEVLFDRELVNQSHKTLQRAEQLASEYHRHALLCDIYNLQRKIVLTKDGPVKAASTLKDWSDKHQIAITCLGENLELWQALFSLGQGASVIGKTLSRQQLQNSDNLQANILRLHIRYADSILNNQIKQGLQAISLLIVTLEQHPLLIEDDPNGYVTTVNNKISLLLFLNDHKEINSLFERLHGLTQRYRIRRGGPSLNRQLLRSYNIELEYYREQFQIDAGYALIPKVNNFLQKIAEILPDEYRLMIFYQFAFFAFTAGEYRQAMQWLNKLNRVTPAQLRPDLRIQAKLLNLCLLFQFNQVSALKYAIDNTRRFIKKHHLATATGSSIVKIFSRLSDLDSYPDQSLLTQIRAELSELAPSPDQRAYLMWLDRYAGHIAVS